MAGDRMCFVLKNSLAELDRMFRHLERFRESAGLSTRNAFEVNIALEELFTNIVLYGYADTADHRISISLSRENETLVIRVEDDGIPFDLTEAPSPNIRCNLEDRTVGGMGIHLIQQYIDEISYSREEDKNILILTKIVGEVGDQRSEIRDQRSEIRDQRSEVRDQRSEIRGQRSEIRGRRSEIGGQRSEIRDQRSEIGGQRSEIRDQRSEIRGRRSEVGGRRSDAENSKPDT